MKEHRISVSEARGGLLALIERAEAERVILTAHDRPVAVILTLQQLTVLETRLEMYERSEPAPSYRRLADGSFKRIDSVGQEQDGHVGLLG